MEEQIEEGPEYPPRKVLISATLGIALAVFLVSLVPHLLPNRLVRCADTILQLLQFLVHRRSICNNRAIAIAPMFFCQMNNCRCC